ncbi:MAG: hypothetical protein ACM3S5_12340 [Rhodospirillales bacterium]
MPAPARKAPASEGLLNYEFCPVPLYLTEQLLASVSPLCTCLCLIVLDRTLGARRRRGTPPPEWCELKESDLAEKLRVTPQAVRKVIREAESCIQDDPDRAKRLGILQVQQARVGVRLRFAFEALPSLKPTREPKKLPTKAEREERRKVQAFSAKITCPKGQDCPVDELYLPNGHLTNILPAGAEVIRHQVDEPDEVATPVAPSGHQEQPQVATPVATSKPSQLEELRAEVEPILLTTLNKTLDDGLARKILAELGDIPPTGLGAFVQATPLRLRKLRQYGSGLLLSFAREFAEAERKLRAARQQEQQTIGEQHEQILSFARARLADPLCPEDEAEMLRRVHPELRDYKPSPSEQRAAIEPRLRAALESLRSGQAGGVTMNAAIRKSTLDLIERYEAACPALVAEIRGDT